MSDRGLEKRPGPCCPKCGCSEWESRYDREGNIDDSVSLFMKDGMYQKKEKVQCFECEAPYTICWVFMAQVSR